MIHPDGAWSGTLAAAGAGWTVHLPAFDAFSIHAPGEGDLRVQQEELNGYIVEQAYRIGVPPDRLAKEIVDRGQLGVAMAEILRGKALRVLAERVKVTDEAGRPVDVKEIAAARDAEISADEAAADEAAADEDVADEDADAGDAED